MSGDVDPDIPGSGAVFTFGKSRFADNVPSHFFIKNDPIVDLACGDQHTAVVCQNGRVFTFGSNEWGQLGLGHCNPVYKPSCLKSIKTIRCKNVALGRAHTLITTAEGQVLSCGANSEGQLGLGDTEPRSSPRLVDSLQRVLAVAAGSNHSTALIGGGDVYVWGSNAEGQLGLGSETTVAVLPTRLVLVQPVVSLATGYYHTLLLTEEGSIWSCGEGDGGRLGLGSEDSESTPTRLDSFPERRYSRLAAGGSHSLALDDEGKLYVWGSNDAGQLGLESDEISLLEPTPCLPELRFHSLSAGQQHSAFVTDEDGLLVCGESRHGKLGTEWTQETFLVKPTPVPKLASLIVIRVACGGCHTAVLAAPNPLPVCQILIEETPENVGKSLPPLIKKVSNSNLLNPPDQLLSPPLNHVGPLRRSSDVGSRLSPEVQDGSEESEVEDEGETWLRHDQYDDIESLEHEATQLHNNLKNAAQNKRGQNEGKISRFFSRLRKSPSSCSAQLKSIQPFESNGKETSSLLVTHQDNQSTSKKSKMCVIL